MRVQLFFIQFHGKPYEKQRKTKLNVVAWLCSGLGVHWCLNESFSSLCLQRCRAIGLDLETLLDGLGSGMDAKTGRVPAIFGWTRPSPGLN